MFEVVRYKILQNSKCFLLFFIISIFSLILTPNSVNSINQFQLMIKYLQKSQLAEILLVALLVTCLTCANPASNIFFEDHLESNMITTSRYALVAQYNEQQKRPILKKLNFDTMKVETILLDKLSDWVADYPISLGDFENGDIALGQGYYLFILDNETLRVKQTLPFPKDDVISAINFYRDPKTNQSTYFIGRGRKSMLVSELQKSEDGKYSLSVARFVSPNNPFDDHFEMTFTSPNTGKAFMGCDLLDCTNTHSIVDRQTDKKYLMKSRKLIAVSQDETFFVLRNDAGSYQLYNLSEDYEVSLKSTFFISKYELKKTELTNDDKFLLASSQTLKNKFNVAKIDILTKEMTLIADYDGSLDNQIDFALFSSNYDRFVTLAKRQDSYYIQLRSFSTQQILDEFQLLFQFVGKDYKLVSSPSWGPNFAVGILIYDRSADRQNDTVLFSFSISGDKISKIKTNDYLLVSFDNLHSSGKYLINYKSRNRWMKLFHFPNLTLAKNIQIINYTAVKIGIQKSTIILENKVYNLEEQISVKGSFFQDPSSMQDPIIMVFQKRGIAYYSSTDIHDQFSRIIYSLSTPSITSSIRLENPFCNSRAFYILPEGDSKCNLVVYLSEEHHPKQQTMDVMLVKYDECSNSTTIYPVRSFRSAVGRVYISSDKKYALIIQTQWNSPQIFMEVRPIASLDKPIYSRSIMIDLQQRRFPYLEGYFMDIAQDNIVVMKTHEFIFTDFVSRRDQAQAQEKNLRYSIE